MGELLRELQVLNLITCRNLVYRPIYIPENVDYNCHECVHDPENNRHCRGYYPIVYRMERGKNELREKDRNL